MAEFFYIVLFLFLLFGLGLFIFIMHCICTYLAGPEPQTNLPAKGAGGSGTLKKPATPEKEPAAEEDDYDDYDPWDD